MLAKGYMNSYRIGHTYVDRGGTSKDGDQFLAWINIKGSGMLNSPGIRPLKYVNRLSDLPAYIVLVTHERTKGELNPWEDLIDHTAGQILYCGDAKFHQKKRHSDFAGNSVLHCVYYYQLDGNKKFIPPILHFSKPSKGSVTFNGLCALDRLELSWFDDHGKPVRNFRTHLTILDTDELFMSWLHNRARATHPRDLTKDAPRAWKDYLKGYVHKLDLWKSSIRSTASQLPRESSEDDEIIAKLYDLTPTEFEAVVVSAVVSKTLSGHLFEEY